MRLILLLLLFFIGYRLIKNLLADREGKKSSVPESSSQSGSKDMVKDPQCSTYIPKDEAIRYRVRGQSYYFCSKECAQRFREMKSAS